MVILKDYKINRNTMALLHVPSAEYQTRILEKDKEIYCTKTSMQLIKEACISGGSTYIGRKKAMEKILRVKSKLPIPINPTEGLFFFPNMSPKEHNCTWISFFNINDYKKFGNDITKTEVVLSDNRKIIVNTSFMSMNRQFGLCGLVIALMYKRVLWDYPNTDYDDFDRF
ncbi:competence protein ComK [Salirhabdus sp. Marseille-P4669]|uniref:competence protein ComK n=1 Tax=Salirhabdus sp. Marseille-P4669 TaxID=2042310 RepID=UPI000C797BC1|nr:competence protein ComK [Salirhabdus sp. Marseille-P4669]